MLVKCNCLALMAFQCPLKFLSEVVPQMVIYILVTIILQQDSTVLYVVALLLQQCVISPPPFITMYTPALPVVHCSLRILVQTYRKCQKWQRLNIHEGETKQNTTHKEKNNPNQTKTHTTQTPNQTNNKQKPYNNPTNTQKETEKPKTNQTRDPQKIYTQHLQNV